MIAQAAIDAVAIHEAGHAVAHVHEGVRFHGQAVIEPVPLSHQKKIRDTEARAEPRPPDKSLDYIVEAIEAEEAREFILRYESLGTIGRPIARYGARDWTGELAAVALFGKTGGNEARNMCGPDYIESAICLERGACAHWAHPHTASWFIPRACRMASANHGWRIFYAYSDPAAGEIGTVYQAAGWLYLGQGVGHGKARPREYFRHLVDTDDKWITDKALRVGRGISIADALAQGWERERRPAKHKYIHFVGTAGERHAMRRALIRTPIKQPYPKRRDGDQACI